MPPFEPPGQPTSPAAGDATPDLVFLATCDLVGLTRGRAVPFADHESVLRGGVGWVPADLAVTAGGHIVDDNAFGATGDLRLVADPGTATDVPADGDAPAVRLYLADQAHLDGTPWSCCPRDALRSALSDLRERAGLRLVASFEHEFVLQGLPASAPMSFARLRLAEPFGSDLVRLLDLAGLEPENWLPEYGEGQYEVTTRPTDALRAADRAVLLRELVRDLARRRGLRATFAPILTAAGTGNGVHIHLSLTDLDGTPVLHDPDRPGGLSEIGARFSAGIVTHARALTGWTAPSPTSFLRLAPHRWSAGGAYIGERNREALLRICPTTPLSRTPVADQLNLEYRAADATANPWLGLAALVRAGLHGIRHYEPARVWPETHSGPGDLAPLPGDTGEALDALESDPVAASWFDPTLLATHLAVRRQDLSDLEVLKPDEACRRMADVY
ncbi:glutamine synthetase family protein [Streptomyces sp. B6B3]|uniref:glutamine synthetase family protein n=1 Tax=Streptomyces sp. B6B3 TaxID=3153570 RepID=UPI00325C7E97